MNVQAEVAERGYAIVRAAVDAPNRALLATALADVVRTRAGARHLMALPAVAGVARNGGLCRIASAVLQAPAIPFRATAFDKTRAANWLVAWHQDTSLPMSTRHDEPGWGPWSRKSGVCYAKAPADVLRRVVALRVHLDDSTEHNGPLRLLPGSHAIGVLDDAALRNAVERVAAVTCVARAGDVVVMRPLTVHASSKALTNAPRRVLHIEYVDALRISDAIELAVV